MNTVRMPRTRIGRWFAGVRAFRILMKNPTDPLHGPIFQMCMEHALLRKVTRGLERHGEGRRLLSERPRLYTSAAELALLRNHPPASLGQACASYYDDNNIVPFEACALPVETDHDYVATRLREAHDVLHVVTGYGTDDLGELELQWFNLGNIGFGPLPFIVLLAFLFQRRAKNYGGIFRVMKHAFRAYARGRRSRALASVLWEDFWHMPVRDVRALLCAPPERSMA